MSKSERGYALAAGRLNQAQPANAPALRGKISVRGAAGPILREMFGHFTSNLQALMVSDDAEVAHQVRVGWRRFRSGLRLFDSAIGADAVPPRQALEPLLEFLGELRDLDVAREQTLPALAERFAAGNGLRSQAWTAMMQTQEDAATTRRKSVRYALQSPAVGVCLLAITQWLEALASPLRLDEEKRRPAPILRDWAEHRVDHLCKKLKKAQKNARTETDLHRVRIMAKRVRYNIEALRDVLPKQATQRRYQHAKELQTRLGATRDLLQAAGLVAALDVDPGLQEYLRGYATGSTRPNESERHLPLIN
jgi:CHAD domain-containing protein